jgi:hypothetical protein
LPWEINEHDYIFVAVIQLEKRMRHILLLHVACPAAQYFSTLFNERKIFGKKRY